MTIGTAGFICPCCGNIAPGFTERVVPVVHPENQRALGWSRRIRTYVHITGDECELPMGPIFTMVQSVP